MEGVAVIIHSVGTEGAHLTLVPALVAAKNAAVAPNVHLALTLVLSFCLDDKATDEIDNLYWKLQMVIHLILHQDALSDGEHNIFIPRKRSVSHGSTGIALGI